MNQKEKTFWFFVFCFVWIYLWLRAAFVNPSHDEIATFFHYVHLGKVWPGLALWDANNHILNSFLTLFSYNLFGSSMLSLRLPALLIAPLYFLFGYLISLNFRSKYFRWGFLICIFFTHYFIEHLAYCRGYGMSMALLLGSVHFTIQYLRNHLNKYLIVSLCFMLLALIANLTLFYSYLFLIILFSLKVILSDARVYRKTRLFLILSPFIVAALGAFVLLYGMQKMNLFYMGGAEGFWEETVNTLAVCLNGNSSIYIQLVIAVLSIYTLLIFFSGWIKDRFHFKFIYAPENLFFLLLWANVCAVVLAHWILNVNYPEDRGAMFLYPFFVGAVFFAADSARLSFYRLSFMPFLILLFPIKSMSWVNLNHHTHYAFKNQQIPKSFVEILIEKEKTNHRKITTSGYRFRHFVFNYWNFVLGSPLSLLHTSDYPTNYSDYVISDKNFKDTLMQYKKLAIDPVTNYQLLERKNFLERTLLLDIPTLHTEGTSQAEFFNLYQSTEMDTIINKSLLFDYSLTFNSPCTPPELSVILEVKTKSSEKKYYEYVRLDWLRTSYHGEKNNFRHLLYVVDIPDDATEIITYVWNRTLIPYELKGGDITIYEILK